MTPRSCLFQIDDRSIEGLVWGDPNSPIIIALHGWLDNAESFYKIAPLLAHYQVVSIDLAGHGRSGWRGRDASYPLWGFIADLYAVQCQLGVPTVRLLAHSLGAGIASMYAGVFAERVSHAALIENLGPMVDEPEQFASQLRESIETSFSDQASPLKPRLTKAVIRSRATGRFPVPLDAAERLVLRASEHLPNDECVLTYDPKLKASSQVRLTEAQVVATLQNIDASVLLVSGQDGLNLDLTQERLPFVKTIEHRILPGGHHLHLQDAVVPELAEQLVRFFDR